MAVSSLCTALRRVVLHHKGLTTKLAASYSTQAAKTTQNIVPLVVQNNGTDTLESLTDIRINFVPKTLNIDFGLPIPNSSKGPILDLPIVNIPTLDRISPSFPVTGDIPEASKSLNLPPGEVIEKQAHRMIVIRRKKIKKHLRQKMRKRLRADLMRLRQKREVRKEKLFFAELEAQIAKAEKFSAPEYVSERLALYKKEIVPKTYKGEILPEAIIKKMLNQDKEKKEKQLNRPRLTL